MKPSNPEFESPKQEQTLFVKDGFLKEIEAGTKTADVRPQDSMVIPEIGDKITFKSSSSEVRVTVKSIERYKNISYLIQTANLSSFGKEITKLNAEAIWRKLYPNYKGGNILVINFELQNV